MQLSLKPALVMLLTTIAQRLFPLEGDSLDPARGILYGLIASAIVWLILDVVVGFALARLVVGP